MPPLPLLVIVCALVAVPLRAQTEFSVLSYNVENAFDVEHDLGKDDHEFLPDGERGWTRSRMWAKLRNIAKVVAAASPSRPVDLVGLCEVENDSVMCALVHRTSLRHMGYRYIMTDSPDARGIDVALVYSPFTFHLKDWRSIPAPPSDRPTRDALYATGTLTNGDTLDVYVVHLPSKLRGRESQRQRRAICQNLLSHADSVSRCRRRPNILMMGDFNDESGSATLRLFTRHGGMTDLARRVRPGTYKYQGGWSSIDHILIRSASLAPRRTEALTLPFLVERDEVHGGVKPRRTYLGTYYHGGVSDHLPLCAFFSLPPR